MIIKLLIAAAVLGSIIYVAIVRWFTRHWISQAHPIKADMAVPPVSVIIVARNEARFILPCLLSVRSALSTLSQYEVILIDDHSTDATADIAQSVSWPQLRVFSLSQFPKLGSYAHAFKKAALHFALEKAQYDIIWTTDADCIATKNSISRMIHQLHATTHSAITGPIKLTGSGILTDWQQLEMCGTIAAINAGIHSKQYYLANMGNMAFYKNDYLQFLQGTTHRYASGDDVLFVQWLQSQGKTIDFCSDVNTIVSTLARHDLTSLLRQRSRWAGKTKVYQSTNYKLLMGSIFFTQVLIWILILFSFWQPLLLGIALLLLLLKSLADYSLIHKVAPFFGYSIHYRHSLAHAVWHSWYIIYVGLCALFPSAYQWKGRRVR